VLRCINNLNLFLKKGDLIMANGFVNKNDITINVKNKDTGNRYIVLFQKPAELRQMYDTLFPIAWKILPLGNNQNNTISYPVQLEIMVKEYQAVYDARTRGTIQNINVGEIWNFKKDGDFTSLTKTGDTTVDGLFGCKNSVPQKIDVGAAKNGTTLVVQRQVGQDELVHFKLTPKIYVAYVRELIEGDLIKSDISQNKLCEVDLTNLLSVDVELSYENEATGKTKWTISNEKFAS
jgi:hypothetical protein